MAQQWIQECFGNLKLLQALKSNTLSKPAHLTKRASGKSGQKKRKANAEHIASQKI